MRNLLAWIYILTDILFALISVQGFGSWPFSNNNNQEKDKSSQPGFQIGDIFPFSKDDTKVEKGFQIGNIFPFSKDDTKAEEGFQIGNIFPFSKDGTKAEKGFQIGNIFSFSKNDTKTEKGFQIGNIFPFSKNDTKTEKGFQIGNIFPFSKDDTKAEKGFQIGNIFRFSKDNTKAEKGFQIGNIFPFSRDDTKAEKDRSLRFDIENYITSTVDLASGVVNEVIENIPTPEIVLDSTKQLVAGYPIEFGFNIINQICSAALFSQTIQPKYTPDISKMKFQLITPCKRFYFPLLEADRLVNSPDFDTKKKVVILASGWTMNPNDTDIISTVAKSYFCRNDTNFIAIDSATFIDTLYTWSAFNTEEIGMHISGGLKILAEKVPLENIHLIGHSLGAHIVGAAGHYFYQNTGKLIPRITGLDPAKPCFNEGESLAGLLRGNAEFIDIVHSNSGVLGNRDPLGDVDFYPGGLSPLSPGCLSIICSHDRSWKYYAETVYPGNERNFMGRRCSSLTKLLEGKCLGEEYPMGFSVPQNLKGNFFLKVNEDSPYGDNGDKQRMLMHENCGICHS